LIRDALSARLIIETHQSMAQSNIQLKILVIM